INTRAARFHLAADRMWNTPPYAIYLSEILGRRTDRAILLDELIDHIVDRLEHLLMHLNVPVAMRHDVVTSAPPPFGAPAPLLPLRGNIVDTYFDLVLLAPFVAELGERIIRAGHPVIPAAECQFTGCVTTPNVWRGDCGDGAERCGLKNGTTR